MSVRIHPTSEVSKQATIGDGSQIWMFCQVRDGAKIGTGCIFGKGVYVDSDVTIGNNVKIQNNVSVFVGVTIEDGVFVGPHVCFTNDKVPRAVNADMSIKSATDWHVTKTLVRPGAALGANATIVCGVTIGRWAMVGSGSVVTKDVPDHALVLGNPARFVAWVCACGERVALAPGSREAPLPLELPTASGQGDASAAAHAGGFVSATGTCTCGRTLVKTPSGVQLG